MADVTTAKQEAPIIHKMSGNSSVSRPSGLSPMMLVAIILVLGLVSGLLVSQFAGKSVSLGGKNQAIEGSLDDIKKGQVYGAADTKAFTDSTEGTLESGGLGEEGSHKLIRPGGDSQTAYVTSSTLELEKFVGRKVKVWGQTFKSQKAGWFMDVGRVEVLE